MLEEYSVRSSDATDDIVYSEFSNIRESDLVSITNEIYSNEINNDNGMSNNNEINNGMSNIESNIKSNNFYKKIIIFCSLILFISGLYIIIN